jgi:hypothetical protein
MEIEYRGQKLPWKEIDCTEPPVSSAMTASRQFRVMACAEPKTERSKTKLK